MKRKPFQFLPLLLAALALGGCQSGTGTPAVGAVVVSLPDTTQRNAYYPSNRAPLRPNALVKLPVGAVKPQGWLYAYLDRQRKGLTGHLGEISAWLQKEDNAWLSPDGQGKWGWEEVPYWLKGYANIGYILDDPAMIAEAGVWIEGALNSQRENGYFGPGFAWASYLSEDQRTEARLQEELKVQDFWANMIMLYCLQSYYEYTSDPRVIELMTKYFRYELSVPDEQFLAASKYWQRIRAGDNLHSVLWLYNRTGEPWLLELAGKIHRNAAPWGGRGFSLDEIGNEKEIRPGLEWPDWYGDLIDWHNVNVAQGFREPAQYYQVSGNPEDLQATYDNFRIVREYFGQVPGGMFGSDENARPGYDDPRQGIETCGIVEQMNSDEHLLRITGDIFWADHAEEVAFNTYPAAVSPDFKSLRYITSPNLVRSDGDNHRPAIGNGGPFFMYNPFSSRCCQHNHTQGWPYYAENLWMATPDNGLAAVLYAASTVQARVGSGQTVQISTESHYPFEEELRFTIHAESPEAFPLYLRIPAWARGAEVWVNGWQVEAAPEPGRYLKLSKAWAEGDRVTLRLPMQLEVRRWEKNHNSASVNYGPLTFSLKIGEQYVQMPSDHTAIHDSKWQEGVDREAWPSFAIEPTTPWNYGLVLDPQPAASFEVVRKPWPADDFPFTPDSAPILLKARARKIPGWTYGPEGLVGELQDSPVLSGEATESVELVPMGAARIRISAFPVIGEGADARVWQVEVP